MHIAAVDCLWPIRDTIGISACLHIIYHCYLWLSCLITRDFPKLHPTLECQSSTSICLRFSNIQRGLVIQSKPQSFQPWSLSSYLLLICCKWEGPLCVLHREYNIASQSWAPSSLTPHHRSFPNPPSHSWGFPFQKLISKCSFSFDYLYFLIAHHKGTKELFSQKAKFCAWNKELETYRERR